MIIKIDKFYEITEKIVNGSKVIVSRVGEESRNRTQKSESLLSAQSIFRLRAPERETGESKRLAVFPLPHSTDADPNHRAASYLPKVVARNYSRLDWNIFSSREN